MTKIVLEKKMFFLFFVGAFSMFLAGCSSQHSLESSAELEKKVAYMEFEPVTRLSFAPVNDAPQRTEEIRIVYAQEAEKLEQVAPAAGQSSN